MGTSGSWSYNHHGGSSGSSPAPNDCTLIAVGSSGSSLTIPLEDITAIWLEQPDLNKDVIPSQIHSSSFCVPYSQSQTKVPTNYTLIHSATEPMAMFFPPARFYYSFISSKYQATVTHQLIAVLPSPLKCQTLCNNVEEILTISLCFDGKHFKERLDGMIRWGLIQIPSTVPHRNQVTRTQVQNLNQPSHSLAAVLVAGAQANRGQTSHSANEINSMLIDNILLNGHPPSTKGPNDLTLGTCRKSKTSGNTALHPLMHSELQSNVIALFTLSEQALGIFKKSNIYDLDYLVALIMHVLHILHDGKAVLDHQLYPLVSNICAWVVWSDN